MLLILRKFVFVAVEKYKKIFSQQFCCAFFFSIQTLENLALGQVKTIKCALYDKFQFWGRRFQCSTTKKLGHKLSRRRNCVRGQPASHGRLT